MYFRRKEPLQGVWKTGNKYIYSCLGTVMIVDFSGDIPTVTYRNIDKFTPAEDWVKVDIIEFVTVMDAIEEFEVKG